MKVEVIEEVEDGKEEDEEEEIENFLLIFVSKCVFFDFSIVSFEEDKFL